AIHQPEHLPWMGFFEKMQRADLFVMLDDVQFSKGDFQNRNRVKGPSGVHWQEKHWKTLVSCYRRSAHFESVAPVFEEFYRRSWTNLASLNVAGIELLAGLLGIEKKWIFASE